MRRNLTGPIAELGLAIRVDDRSGDTSQTRKKAQRADPPHILLTTPESLALLLSYEDSPRMFAGLKRVVVDELHALAEVETRRPADAAADPARGAGAGAAPGRAVGHGGRPAGAGALLPRRRLRRAHRRSRPAPRYPHAPDRHRAAVVGRRRALRDPRSAGRGQAAQDHADLPQHPGAGGDLLSPPLACQPRGSADRHPPRLARPQRPREGRGGDAARRAERRSSAPAPSISGSTGATSTW